MAKQKEEQWEDHKAHGMSELRNNNESVKGKLDKDVLRLTQQERQEVALGFLGFM